MVRFYRRDIKTSDILNCPDEELRRNFRNSAKTIGRFETESGNITAHILHQRPLLIGTISSETIGRFYPESPGLYNKFSNCSLKDRHEATNYSIFQCENIPGSVYELDIAYPKIKPKENSVVLACDTQKFITNDSEDVGGIVTKLGTNEFYEVICKDGKVDVDEFRDLYDKNV